MSCSRSKIGGEQRVLKLREQLGIDFLFTGDQVLDLGGDLRAGLRDRLLQPVEQRPALLGLLAFVILAKDRKHKCFAAMRGESLILAEEDLLTRRATCREALPGANSLRLLYDATNRLGLGLSQP